MCRMKEINLLHELNNISKTHQLQRNDIDQIMIEFAGRITHSLKIERMSVWLLDREKKEMISLGEYDSDSESFQKDTVISMSLCPQYFEALEKDELLYVENVRESEITKGLNDIYSIPNDIITLLDIPLRFQGEMIGVMCFEKKGNEIKHFNDGERFFAHAISLVFSSNLEARKRRALQKHLDQELREKEILLREVHHRVKNNLSVISSLIRLQTNKAKDDYHKELLEDCLGKVQSIADIHDVVYRSNSFAAVDVKSYFTQLLDGIKRLHASDSNKVDLLIDLESFELPIKELIPLGLIVNEVVTNCYKHAFEEIENGKINFQLKKNNSELHLIISDNGIGFQENQTDTNNLGMEIVNDLAEQIEAECSFIGGKQGTIFELKAAVPS